jgi:hypothetical protein
MKREIKGRKFLKRKVFKQANSIGPYLLRKEPPFQSNVSKTERIYYYLEDKKLEDQGIIVFDELEKSKSHILVSQLENYFKKTSNGRQRSGLVIPEPFFVHSDLTTGIQIADLIAYIISWGMRLKGMTEPIRPEMEEFVELIKPLRYLTTREVGDIPEMKIWSVIYVK